MPGTVKLISILGVWFVLWWVLAFISPEGLDVGGSCMVATGVCLLALGVRWLWLRRKGRR